MPTILSDQALIAVSFVNYVKIGIKTHTVELPKTYPSKTYTHPLSKT